MITTEQHFVFGTLTAVLILFVWGKFRHDIVALLALFALVLLGIIDPTDAFSGFGHPAVITVAAVLVIGKALEFSGLIDLLGRLVTKVGDGLVVQLTTLCIIVAVASAFMNNVGALAILMPVAIHLARSHQRPASLYLMPLAFASLLGGMTTLIGTPPNIIVAEFRASETGVPFSLFEFAPVGGVVLVSGVIFIVLVGWRLLPRRRSENGEDGLFQVEDYLSEVEVPEGSVAQGLSIREVMEHSKAEVAVLGLVRDGEHYHAPPKGMAVRTGDILVLESDAEQLKTFTTDTGTQLVGDTGLDLRGKGKHRVAIMEAVVMAGSPLFGRTASSLRLRSRYGINLLALARKEQRIVRRLDHVEFQTGDVLLLQGYEENLSDVVAGLGCLPLATRELRIGYKRKVPLALGIFGLSITAVVAGLLPVQVAFMMAAVAMVLGNVLPLKRVYDSVDWPVIVLLGAMIPVGQALETSGAAGLVAGMIQHSAGALPPWALLTIVLVITMFLSDIINNAATVVLMAPIAIGVAKSAGFSVDPFLMAVAIGGSSAFLTPIGHQSNTLIMGPGGYRFSDYWRMGLPLEVLIVVVGVPMILWVWPL
ncbi:MAG: SLC13 family permease [Flavobacteriales bacterium]|nr:SLC13 family permease [Flavobacteriales bacterium]